MKQDIATQADAIYTQQPEREDLPLVIMPDVFEGMIEPFQQWFPEFNNLARLKMYKDFTLDEDKIIKRCAGADVVIVIGFHVSPRIYNALKSHVKCFAFGGTGVASYIDLAEAKKDGIRVCNVRHYGDHAVAELAFALMLELARHVGKMDTDVRAGKWDGTEGAELFGRTLGIVGLGGIGKTVAKMAQGFGMKVAAWNSGRSQENFEELGITPYNTIGDLMAASDVVSIHLPLVPGTRGLIGAEELGRMRPGTMFINTARAEVVQEDALLSRLQKGDIPAGLDVFYHEPLPMDSPFREIPGIVLTPHIGWLTDNAYVSLTKQVVQCVSAFCKGEEFNVVE